MSFAVAVTRTDGAWQVRAFEDRFSNPSRTIRTVRELRSEGAAFALLCVDDEYFVILRPTPSGVQVLLSDVTMAVDDDYAEKLAADAGIEVPDLDPDELDEIDGWPDGNFAVLEDLGLSEELLSVIADDAERWPHESIEWIADELGFVDELFEAAGY